MLFRSAIFPSFALVFGLLLFLPSFAAAKAPGGGCGGQCACANRGSDSQADAEDLKRGCGQGRGQGEGIRGGNGYGQGPREGQGKGRSAGQKGNHAKMADARTLVHNHESIEREIEDIPGGVRTVTTSDDPEMVTVLQKHVADMKDILESGGMVRRWDPLFVELFEHSDEIQMEIQKLADGLEVRETSENPRVTELIRAHARKVNEFVAEGPEAAHRPTAVPPIEETSD